MAKHCLIILMNASKRILRIVVDGKILIKGLPTTLL